MTKVVIAGGTGALGRRISDDLADRWHDVVVLTRSPKPGRHRQVQWEGVTAHQLPSRSDPRAGRSVETTGEPCSGVDPGEHARNLR
ncbi:hypothetical protein [Rhodococcus erythropolis]